MDYGLTDLTDSKSNKSVIYGFWNGFGNYSQIRTDFQNPYGFPKSIQLQIPYDLYGLYHLNLNVNIKYKKFLNQPLGSINLFVYANPYGICNCIDFENPYGFNMDYGLDLD